MKLLNTFVFDELVRFGVSPEKAAEIADACFGADIVFRRKHEVGIVALVVRIAALMSEVDKLVDELASYPHCANCKYHFGRQGVNCAPHPHGRPKNECLDFERKK